MSVSIKNTARGMRGVNTVGGLVYLNPNETRDDLDVADAELAAMRNDTPYFEINGKAPAAPAAADSLDDMSVADLTKLAADEGVTLPEKGTGANDRVVKADIVKAITDARVAAGAGTGEPDELDAMDDDTLRATVQALTGEAAPADADRTALLALARGDKQE
jgi:hypothetical protein